MSDFLKLNGAPVPVQLGTARKRYREFGSRRPSYTGGARMQIRARKREYDMQSIMLPKSDVDALVGMINGEGDIWPFDSSIYSSKGITSGGTPVYTLHDELAADGDPVLDAGQYGGSMEISFSTTNELLADSRDAENAPTGFLALAGATLSGDTSNFWQGTKSLKTITAAAPSSGFYVNGPIGPFLINDTLHGSVYLKGDSGGELVTVYVRDVANGTNGTLVNATLQANTWTRVEANITLGAASADVRIYVINQGSGAYTFYADGLQLEVQDWVTGWVDGSRGIPQFRVTSVKYLRTPNTTFNFWTKGPPFGRTALGYPFYLRSDGLAQLWARGLYHGAGNRLQFIIKDAATGATSTLEVVNPWDGGWHMVTCVSRAVAGPGEYRQEIFIDGISVAQASADFTPDYTEYDQLFFGEIGEVNAWNGKLDDFLAAPYAASPDMIAGWYAAGRAMGAVPTLIATGDFVCQQELEVVGEARGTNYRPYVDDSGNYLNNAQQLQFKLWER